MSGSMDGTSEETTRPMAIEPLFPSGEAVIDGHLAGEPADGRGDEAAADREEGQRRLQVFSAVGEYLGSRNRHGKRRHE